MEMQTEVTEATEETQDAARTEANETNGEAVAVAIPAMDTIQKAYFSATNLEAGQEAANTAIQIVQAANGAQQFNFNPEEALPEFYGLAIAPKNVRDPVTKTTKTIGVTIGAIPEYSLLMQTEAGMAWVQETVQNALITKLANAVRIRSDGSEAPSVPFTVEDFITSNRPEGVLVAFRKLAGAYVKLLKTKNMPLMSPDILRQILMSSAFAESQYPIPQATWVKILQSMIAKAEKENLAAGLLTEWLETRDNAGLPKVKADSLDDLDFSKL